MLLFNSLRCFGLLFSIFNMQFFSRYSKDRKNFLFTLVFCIWFLLLLVWISSNVSCLGFNELKSVHLYVAANLYSFLLVFLQISCLPYCLSHLPFERGDFVILTYRFLKLYIFFSVLSSNWMISIWLPSVSFVLPLYSFHHKV